MRTHLFLARLLLLPFHLLAQEPLASPDGAPPASTAPAGPGVFSLASPGGAVPADSVPVTLVPTGPNVFVELQVFALPNADAVPIIRALSDPKTRRQGLDALDAKVLADKARIVGWTMVTTLNGQRASVENTREFRFATEYSAGGVGIYYSEGTEQIRKEERNVEGADFHSVPTTFETRSYGLSLEVEPDVSQDGKTIRLNVLPQHSRLAAMHQVNITKEKTGERVITEQPEFEVSKTYTSFVMDSGSRILLGVFPAAEQKPSMELFILRAEVRGTK